jgi:cytochrome c-type biogenesis protein CcmH
VFDMMQAGKSDGDIKTFLVERYGEFVLYRPPLERQTLFLWFMPALLLVIGGWVLIRRIRKLAAEAPDIPDTEDETN